MKYILMVFIVLSFSQYINSQTLFNKDVFPLSINNNWKYSYYFHEFDVGNMDGWGQIDSGIVKYSIKDSSSNSDTIFWTVQKIRFIFRTIQQIEALRIAFETTYVVSDSTTFKMNELKKGNHLLSITDQMSFSSVWPFYSSECGNDTVYRYQFVDTTIKTYSLKTTFCSHPNQFYMNYQMIFKPDSGLVSCTANGNLGYHSHSGAILTCKLIQSNVILGYKTKDEPLIPDEEIILYQNYPNPFNPTTIIRFSIPNSGDIRLSIFNILGQEISILANSYFISGKHEITWNANKNPSGIYYCKLQTINSAKVKSILFIK